MMMMVAMVGGGGGLCRNDEEWPSPPHQGTKKIPCMIERVRPLPCMIDRARPLPCRHSKGESGPTWPLHSMIVELEEELQLGLPPSHHVALLRRCGSAWNLPYGRRIHSALLRRGLADGTFVGNTLVEMYGKCGAPDEARAAFDSILHPNAFSWNAIVSAYARNGLAGEALSLFFFMLKEGVPLHRSTLSTLLGSCPTLSEGKVIHAYLATNCWMNSSLATDGSLAMNSSFSKDSLFATDSSLAANNSLSTDSLLAANSSLGTNGLFLDTALVAMYGKCGSVVDAWEMFKRMRKRNTVSWTVIIDGFIRNGHGKDALDLFWSMQEEEKEEEVWPDGFLFSTVLSSCSQLAEVKSIHARIIASGIEPNIYLQTALLDTYGKCGSLPDARSTFRQIHRPNVVSWSAMIGALGHNSGDGGECGDEAWHLLWKMQKAGIRPNGVTFLSSLSACSNLVQGKTIHASIVDRQQGDNPVLASALINMYGKHGSLVDAREMFDRSFPSPSVVSWGTIISAYVRNGYNREAMELFHAMQEKGQKPDGSIFASILGACSDLSEGKMIHARILSSQFNPHMVLENALIDMYGKCGSLEHARSMFLKMGGRRDVVSWSAIIAAYGLNGHGKDALQLFQEMREAGVQPNGITFLSLLSACRHAGLVEEGRLFLASMSRDFGINPTMDHYRCMVDLLGRAGLLNEAEELIKSMPFEPGSVDWITLLSACRIHEDVESGIRAAKRVFKLDPNNAAPFVLLSNIYAAAGRWDDVAKLRKEMRNMHLKTKT